MIGSSFLPTLWIPKMTCFIESTISDRSEALAAAAALTIAPGKMCGVRAA